MNEPYADADVINTSVRKMMSSRSYHTVYDVIREIENDNSENDFRIGWRLQYVKNEDDVDDDENVGNLWIYARFKSSEPHTTHSQSR